MSRKSRVLYSSRVIFYAVEEESLAHCQFHMGTPCIASVYYLNQILCTVVAPHSLDKTFD